LVKEYQITQLKIENFSEVVKRTETADMWTEIPKDTRPRYQSITPNSTTQEA
jgi:hypothetical protein